MGDARCSVVFSGLGARGERGVGRALRWPFSLGSAADLGPEIEAENVDLSLEPAEGLVGPVLHQFGVGNGLAVGDTDAWAEEVRCFSPWECVIDAVQGCREDGALGTFDEHGDAAFELAHRGVGGGLLS